MGTKDVCTGITHSVYEVAEIISGLTGAPIRHEDDRPGDIREPAQTWPWVHDFVAISLEEGIKRTLEYFQ